MNTILQNKDAGLDTPRLTILGINQYRVSCVDPYFTSRSWRCANCSVAGTCIVTLNKYGNPYDRIFSLTPEQRAKCKPTSNPVMGCIQPRVIAQILLIPCLARDAKAPFTKVRPMAKLPLLLET